ncbi:MAG: hypothetical protein ACRD1A_10930 [Terriglobales bacterium]
MSFVEMTAVEWDAVYKHHDALIQMAELELEAERIRKNCPDANQVRLLQPIQGRIHELDSVIAGLPA